MVDTLLEHATGGSRRSLWRGPAVVSAKNTEQIKELWGQRRIYIGARWSMAPGPEVPGGPFESKKDLEYLFY